MQVNQAKCRVLPLGHPNPRKAPGWGRGAGKLEKALGVLVAAAGHEPSCAQGAGGQWPRGCGSPSVGTGPGQGLSLCWELGRPPWNPGGSSGPSARRDLEGLERVQGREGSWEGSGAAGGAEGAGGAHPGAKEAQGGPSGSASPCQEGGAGGVGLCCQGTRDRPRGNGLRLGQGRVRLGLRRNLLLERVGRPWQGLPREVWSAHPWRCPRKAWPWHSVLWAGGQGGDGARGGSMGWEGFSSLRDPGVCSAHSSVPVLPLGVNRSLCSMFSIPTHSLWPWSDTSALCGALRGCSSSLGGGFGAGVCSECF
ncbi:uncharacterized PE-PGRS family protein PE_PGRS54-like [Manacus candei]|uniref:uncharacterized PE-PGRS family protein PE_PGRS54-like n=1 Tax=Manacus candei TaxID=415023 RepID=UPI002226B2B3|nr:uncharacterized PE-PGRS family protein PE_PGRS54-like [Manacus candei]XP_051629697.1 uncharacterized PE-PGRS family protein PE_PGRS54-like [Manacus candei]